MAVPRLSFLSANNPIYFSDFTLAFSPISTMFSRDFFHRTVKCCGCEQKV